ncbi:MAG: polysaccharide biosynthesis/export family protein [Verrucomicrobiaceae bacterium]|nr:polysaccharide biosynthesis/export family protein [Verrucomicrobiaceae bacterium]
MKTPSCLLVTAFLIGLQTVSVCAGEGTGGVRSHVTGMTAVDRAYVIRNHDILLFRIWNEHKPTVRLRVGDTGCVRIPGVGIIRATGVIPKQLAHSIEQHLKTATGHSCVVLIEIDGIDTVRCTESTWIATAVYKRPANGITVFGEVNKQGVYPYLPDALETVSKLIAKAGGTKAHVWFPRIRLVRRTPQGNKWVLVNTKACLKGQNDFDLFLRPGDVLIVD